MSVFDSQGHFESAFAPASCGPTIDTPQGSTANTIDINGRFIAWDGMYKGSVFFEDGTNAIGSSPFPVYGVNFEHYSSGGAAQIFSLLERHVSEAGGPATCFRGGCSNQLCSDQPGLSSTCGWLPQYACYQQAPCERQPNGTCGHTPSSTLTACLANAGP